MSVTRAATRSVWAARADGLKGAFANLAATPAALLAAQLKQVCSTGTTGGTNLITRELEEEISCVSLALEQLAGVPLALSTRAL